MEKNDNPARTIAIEGNGCRPSHRGGGYIESEIMYTLNTTEIHAVCYCIQSPEFNKKQHGIGISEEISFTLNNMDHHAVLCEINK